MKKIMLIALSSAILMGCSSSNEELDSFLAKPGEVKYVPMKKNVVASMSAVEFNHVADPFSNSVGIQNVITPDNVVEKTQTGVDAGKQSLDNSPLDGLRLVGVWIDTKLGSYALIKTGDGFVHKARVGDKIGLKQGVITSIKPKEISVKEVLPDNFGGQSVVVTVIKSEG